MSGKPVPPRSRRLRVAVADDSSFIRRAIARLLEQEPDLQLVGSAGSGEELLDHLERWSPDAIVLDLSMPGMGGLATLDRIMAGRPTPVLILSTHSKKDAPQTIEALHRGAMDFIDKQQYSLVDFEALRTVLVEKLRQITGGSAPAVGATVGRAAAAAEIAAPAALSEARGPESVPGAIEAVLIGASTGGPPAVERLLRDLAADNWPVPAPVLIVQHMPAGFTRAFADRLNAYLPLQVREAAHQEPLLPGTVYIAPGGLHLRVQREGIGLRAMLSTTPETAVHRPAVDVLFDSAAAVVAHRAIAVLLTGMGQDGAKGMAALAAAGAPTLAQDEATSVVYGMPRAAVLAGAAREVLPLDRIGGRVREILEGGGVGAV
jgi:two-component system chemotaxis response regulator CheB